MNISNGLSECHPPDAASLFLDSLGDKFYPILKDKQKAHKLLELSINQSNCFSAVSDKKLFGILAYQVNNTNFLSISFRNIISVYGVFSGIIKALALSQLEHQTDRNDIYIEAVAVSEAARGQGVGTKLFEALFDYAAGHKFNSITLQVIDTNPKAEALYKRLGFEIVNKSKIWPFNMLLGWKFREVVLMKKKLDIFQTH